MQETVIVTGASQGIGLEVWKLFAEYDYHVVGIARNGERLAWEGGQLRKQGKDVDWVAVDLCSQDGVEQFCQEFLSAEPYLHGVIFNAGYAANEAFQATTSKELKQEWQVNLHSVQQMLHRFLPYCVEQGDGRFIAMGSLSMVTSFPGNANYAATKAALACFWRSLRFEYAQQGLQFGLVLPGLTDTGLSAKIDTILPRRSPEAVARLTWDVYHAPRLEQTLGLENHLAQLANRLAPRTMDKVLRRFSRYLLAQDF